MVASTSAGVVPPASRDARSSDSDKCLLDVLCPDTFDFSGKSKMTNSSGSDPGTTAIRIPGGSIVIVSNEPGASRDPLKGYVSSRYARPGAVGSVNKIVLPCPSVLFAQMRP